VHPRWRTPVTAVLTTLACVALAISVFLVFPAMRIAMGAKAGHGEEVVYTFAEKRCVHGPGQLQNCSWIGTVTTDNDVRIPNVAFEDTPPAEVMDGTRIPAIWSPRNSTIAYSIGSSRAWVSTVASVALASVLALVFFVLAILWWHRLLRDWLTSRRVHTSRD